MHVHTLRDLKQVRAMADPLRMRILHELARTPMTTMQLARLLDEKMTKLYHHVEALEKAGLIELAETRQNRGFVEKRYRAIADDFRIESSLLSMTADSDAINDNYTKLYLSALETTVIEARRSASVGHIQKAGETQNAFICRLSVTGGEARISELIGRLTEFVQSVQPGSKDGQEYMLTIALCPIEASDSQP